MGLIYVTKAPTFMKDFLPTPCNYFCKDNDLFDSFEWTDSAFEGDLEGAWDGAFDIFECTDSGPLESFWELDLWSYFKRASVGGPWYGLNEVGSNLPSSKFYLSIAISAWLAVIGSP